VTPTGVIGVFNVDFSGKYLYVSNVNLNSVSLHRIDAMTGAMTLVDTEPAGTQPRSVSAYGFQPQ
jgi:6-phosphogluconolactonase (cycloisomerase 2 family)